MIFDGRRCLLSIIPRKIEKFARDDNDNDTNKIILLTMSISMLLLCLGARPYKGYGRGYETS